MRSQRRYVAFFLAASIGALAESALGQPASVPPPRGRIDLTAPPPPPSEPRSYHMHDGFYARANLGIGSLWATFDDDHPSGDDLRGAGMQFSLDLLLGGSPSPDVAIGGGLMLLGAPSVDLERGRLEQDRAVQAAVVGAFIDGFPMPNKGWHFGGFIGFAGVNIEKNANDDIQETGGFGGAFWFGHDFWVAGEWSVGPLLRFAGTLTGSDERSVDVSTFSATLAFTGLYH